MTVWRDGLEAHQDWCTALTRHVGCLRNRLYGITLTANGGGGRPTAFSAGDLDRHRREQSGCEEFAIPEAWNNSAPKVLRVTRNDTRNSGLYSLSPIDCSPPASHARHRPIWRSSTSMQWSCTTSIPARASASATASLRIPSCIQTSFGCTARMSSRCCGMSGGRRNI